MRFDIGTDSAAHAAAVAADTAHTHADEVLLLLVSRLRWEKGLRAFADTVREAQALLGARAAAAGDERSRGTLVTPL